MRRLSPARAVWWAFALAPLPILAEADGSWRHARNRLAVFAALYLVGWLVLLTDPPARHRRWGSRRAPVGGGADPLAARREHPARDLVVTGVILLLLLAIVASPAELVLAAMLLLVAFHGLTSRLAPGRLAAARRLIVWTVTVAVLAVAIGEAVFRLPPVVARTGGPPPHRERVWRALGDELERANAIYTQALRSRHLGEPKPDGALRIVTLGDSHTHGDWVASADAIWPYVLERRLAERGLPVEVVNLGATGANTAVEARLLAAWGDWIEPDLVVLQYALNDPLPAPDLRDAAAGAGEAVAGEGAAAAGEAFAGTVPLVPLLDRGLRRESYLYDFLARRFSELQLSWRGIDFADLYADGSPHWRQSRAALAAMAGWARQRGIPMLVVLFPSFEGELGAGAYRWTELHHRVAGAADELGVAFLDLRASFARRAPRGRAWRVEPWDRRPGVEAHAVAGEAVAREVVARGLLGGARCADGEAGDGQGSR